ncbi:hypothetical protein R3P38DRAFT_95843 [Favolaschia claudopus]|uniref:Alpha-type protein kinase domain-containing protein n=1 Tax=Favolaschia claudopus TaxID=2862362 RepID=A0AAW0D7N2_9AGAR
MFLGIGTFKTAEPAFLTLVHLSPHTLGANKNQKVAVKRMYTRRRKPTEANPDAWVINRLATADEHRKILMEANVLLWATSLFNFAFAFIHSFISRSSTPPPFEIPTIRFVQAGVALLYEQPSTLGGNKPGISRSYLVEERIEEPRKGFYKFINNGSAAVLPQRDASLQTLAEFLAFTQHIQFWKTKGMVYISDLQGSATLLTDPQIMTSPEIGDGIEIFGDGNVPSAFKAFPEEHVCNHFCEWFQLPALDG